MRLILITACYYPSCIFQILARKACNTHLYDMVTEVNAIVKQREGWNPESKYHRYSCFEIPKFLHTTPSLFESVIFLFSVSLI